MRPQVRARMRGLAFASSLLGILANGGAQRVTDENMNGEYLLAQTPRGHGNWTTNFKDYPGGVESFTFYAGPINSTYSEVFWTSLPEVNLPAEIVKRCKGKAMAIVGFESDQVRRTPDGDVSLPINLAVRPYLSVVSTQFHLKAVLLCVRSTTITTAQRCSALAPTWSVCLTTPKMVGVQSCSRQNQDGTQSLSSMPSLGMVCPQVCGVATPTGASSANRITACPRPLRR